MTIVLETLNLSNQSNDHKLRLSRSCSNALMSEVLAIDRYNLMSSTNIYKEHGQSVNFLRPGHNFLFAFICESFQNADKETFISLFKTYTQV